MLVCKHLENKDSYEILVKITYCLFRQNYKVILLQLMEKIES